MHPPLGLQMQPSARPVHPSAWDRLEAVRHLLKRSSLPAASYLLCPGSPSAAPQVCRLRPEGGRSPACPRHACRPSHRVGRSGSGPLFRVTGNLNCADTAAVVVPPHACSDCACRLWCLTSCASTRLSVTVVGPLNS